MNAQKLHEECHAACRVCPQFRPFKGHLWIPKYGFFRDIPKKGVWNVLKFWMGYHGDTLWEMGYAAELSRETLELFSSIDGIINKALKEHFGEKT